MGGNRITELALRRIWQSGRLARELRTIDGSRVQVIYPGVWTHSDGPDFRDALIDLSGTLVRGSVELHLRAGDWRRHGHDTNPAYDTVILHAVLDNDLDAALEQPAGRVVPTVELRNYLSDDDLDVAREPDAGPLGSLGRFTCLPTMAGGRVEHIRVALQREGWKRLVEKQLRFSQEFERLAPAEVLYNGLLDGLGLTRNRDGMARVADRLPLALIEHSTAEHGPSAASALLLGAGGFLPLSPAEAHLAEIAIAESGHLCDLFYRIANSVGVEPVPATAWDLRRVRPMNHPARRLSSLASLINASAPTGILGRCLNVQDQVADPWRTWLASATPAIGTSRAMQLTTNVLAPFLAAYAQASGDADMIDQTAAIWERLPGRADDEIARSTLHQIVGDQRFPIRLAVEAQGLHQIGRHGCRLLRCFECPVAELAMTYERPGL